MKRQKRKTRCEIFVGKLSATAGSIGSWHPVDRAVRTGNGNELHYQHRPFGRVVVTGVTRHWRLVPVTRHAAGGR